MGKYLIVVIVDWYLFLLGVKALSSEDEKQSLLNISTWFYDFGVVYLLFSWAVGAVTRTLAFHLQ